MAGDAWGAGAGAQDEEVFRYLNKLYGYAGMFQLTTRVRVEMGRGPTRRT